MRLASKGGIGWWERERFRWFRLRKRVYQWCRYRPGQAKTVLFIVGCQRSGTSMLSHLFRLDWDVVTYDETSSLSTQDPEGFRLDPLPQVKTLIAADRAPLVVCKPLVESQNTAQLLVEFPNSRAIWMFRDFRDVVRSNLAFFGEENGHSDLAPMLAGNDTDWRAEGLTDSDRNLLRKLAEVPLTGNDAAALFWWARNRLYFSEGLADDKRVARCDYDELVGYPAGVIAAAYAHLGRDYPGDYLVRDVVTGLRGRGQKIRLRPDVAELCTDMLAQLRGNLGRRLLAPH